MILEDMLDGALDRSDQRWQSLFKKVVIGLIQNPLMVLIEAVFFRVVLWCLTFVLAGKRYKHRDLCSQDDKQQAWCIESEDES